MIMVIVPLLNLQEEGFNDPLFSHFGVIMLIIQLERTKILFQRLWPRSESWCSVTLHTYRSKTWQNLKINILINFCSRRINYWNPPRKSHIPLNTDGHELPKYNQ